MAWPALPVLLERSGAVSHGGLGVEMPGTERPRRMPAAFIREAPARIYDPADISGTQRRKTLRPPAHAAPGVTVTARIKRKIRLTFTGGSFDDPDRESRTSPQAGLKRFGQMPNSPAGDVELAAHRPYCKATESFLEVSAGTWSGERRPLI